MTPAAPVMADVARLAGVSLQTVSRVVNDSPHVSGPTRARVIAAMDHLDYRRNSVARALVTRRSGVIGVLTSDVVLHGPVRILYGVEQAATRLGLGVGIAVVERMTTDALSRALRRLQDQAVEGVVAITPHQDAVPVLTAALGSTPTVLVGSTTAGPLSVPAIELDQHGGAVAATRHLLDLGHSRVHHLAGPQEWLSARLRVDGWRAAPAGAPAPQLQEGDWGARSGHSAMRALLATDPDLTAVFVANDQMAFGALSALAESGRRVPEDVSVVGFDDIPEAEFFQPPLTTVRQRFDEAGEKAVHALLTTIRPERTTETPDLIAAELVTRASTARRPTPRARSRRWPGR